VLPLSLNDLGIRMVDDHLSAVIRYRSVRGREIVVQVAFPVRDLLEEEHVPLLCGIRF